MLLCGSCQETSERVKVTATSSCPLIPMRHHSSLSPMDSWATILLSRASHRTATCGSAFTIKGCCGLIKLSPSLDGFRICQRGLRLCKLSLGLIESCLKRAGINLKEELALLDEGAFLISLLQQIAGDLSSDVRVFQPVECARHWPRL